MTHHRRNVSLVSLIGGAVLLGPLATAVRADDTEVFYGSRSISMIIGFSVGGGYDLYGRLMSRYMRRYLPGNPQIIPKNMEGAGSLRTANYLNSAAARDGSVIGTFSRTIPLAPLLGGASFDSRKLTWLGSVAQDVVVCFTWHTSAIRTWHDFLTKPSLLGGDGAGAEPDLYAHFMKNIFDAKVKLASGYGGTSEIFLAIERGELEGACGISWGTIVSRRPDWIKQHSINVIVQAGLHRHSNLPQVPSLGELATDSEQAQIIKLLVTTLAMSRPFAAPPDVPPERKAALVSAFEQATRDPELKEEAGRMNLDVDLVPGAVVDQLLADAYKTPKDVIAKTTAAISK